MNLWFYGDKCQGQPVYFHLNTRRYCLKRDHNKRNSKLKHILQYLYQLHRLRFPESIHRCTYTYKMNINVFVPPLECFDGK